MHHDPLSDVLRSVRLRGALFYYVSCSDAWVAATPPAPQLAPAVMPGAEHVVAYHLLARGDAWAATEGLPPAHLARGDIVLFPRGDSHVMSSAPGLPIPETIDDADWVAATRNDPKPIPVALHRGGTHHGSELPDDECVTVVLCGFIGCDLRPFNPLIAALPRLLHLRPDGQANWASVLLERAVADARAARPGSAALLEQASELVFVDAARRHLESLPDGASGWLAALRDRHVGKAIRLLHEDPAHPWSVATLGLAVGLSRSALHERFVTLVGQPPMQYLARWRIQRGANLLRDGDASVAAVAQEVGYESEAAFTRAFKRLVGLPPAAWRRAQRQPA